MANDSIEYEFSMPIPLGFLENPRLSKHTNFLIESAYLDSCGVKHAAIHAINTRVVPSTIWAVNYGLEKCYNDSVMAQILGDNSNLLWSPNYGISNIHSSTPWLYPATDTTYIVTNLNDSTKIAVRVQVPIKSIGLQVVGNQIFVDNNVRGVWYYNGFPYHWGGLALTTTASVGTHYVKIVSGGCEAWSDTLKITNPSIASSGQFPVDSVFRIMQVRKMWVYFKGSSGARMLTQAEVKLGNYVGNNPVTWRYTIMENTPTYPTVRTGILNLNNNLLPNINLPLDTAMGYILYIYNNSFNTFDMHFYRHNALPFVDDMNHVQIDSGRVDGITFFYKDMVAPVLFYIGNVIDVEENERLSSDIFPNPFADIIRLQPDFIGNIKIFDSLGRIIYDQIITEPSEINLSHLPQGVYYSRLENNKGAVTFTKLIKAD